MNIQFAVACRLNSKNRNRILKMLPSFETHHMYLKDLKPLLWENSLVNTSTKVIVKCFYLHDSEQNVDDVNKVEQ